MTLANGISGSSRANTGGHAASLSQYSVHKGDTLSSIAARHGVTLGALERANPAIASQRFIFPGDKLMIPSAGQGGTGQTGASHTIQRGETLSSIAAKNNTSISALMKANPEIRNANQIYPDQIIRIPSMQTSSGQGVYEPQTPKAPSSKIAAANAIPAIPVGPAASGKINLQQFFDPSKGSQSPAAIIIGNAEGNRTPSGGFRSGYDGHIDPGNGKGNRGSFSYQHGTKSMTPQQADRAQLTKLSKLIPAYEAAAKKAGLDPNNATLITAYFDLFNQSESAAGRFLNQMGYLKTAGISNQSVTELRFRSFINPETGQRWTPRTASGFQNIANSKYGGKATEVQFQTVVRNDQARRQNAMVDAMKVQGVSGAVSSANPTRLASSNPPEALQASSSKSQLLTKWPVSNPKINIADKPKEGDGHYGTDRKAGKHGGIDLVGKVGDPIFAAGAGRIVKIEPAYSEQFGYQLVIDHGNSVFTQYAHLQKGSIKVKIGDTIAAGQNIAAMGRTGNTPPLGDTHLHFEVRIGSAKARLQGGQTVDPLKYLGKL